MAEISDNSKEKLNKFTDYITSFLDSTKNEILVINNYKKFISSFLSSFQDKDEEYLKNNISAICEQLLIIKKSIIKTVYKSFDLSRFNIVSDYLNNPNDDNYYLLRQCIDNLMPSFNQCIKIFDELVSKKTYLAIRIEQVLDLISLDDNNLFKKPIDSDEKFYLIKNVMNGCKMGYPMVVPTLMALNEVNHNTFVYREKIIRQKIATQKKVQIRLQLLQKNQNKSVEKVEQVDNVSNEDKLLINRINDILRDNQNIIVTGFSEDTITGYSLIDYSDQNPFDIDSLDYANYQIILYTLIKLNNLCKQGIDDELRKKINITIAGYEKYKDILNHAELKQNEILLFEQENSDIFQSVKELLERFKYLEYSLTDLDHNYIKNIEKFENDERKNSDDEDAVKENVNSYINQITKHCSNLSYNLYKEFQYLERIYVAYQIYKEEENLDVKKLQFNDLVQEVNQYFIFKDNIESLENDSLEENINNVLFLPFSENETTFGRYLSGEKISKDDIIDIGRIINNLLTNDESRNFRNSRKVLGGRYSERLRRIRIKNVRVVYADLSKLCSFDFKLDKPCYVAVAGGIKHDSNEIYDYAIGISTTSAIDSFIDLVESKAKDLKLKYNYEDGNRLFNEFIISLINRGNDMILTEIPNLDDEIKVKLRGGE